MFIPSYYNCVLVNLEVLPHFFRLQTKSRITRRTGHLGNQITAAYAVQQPVHSVAVILLSESDFMNIMINYIILLKYVLYQLCALFETSSKHKWHVNYTVQAGPSAGYYLLWFIWRILQIPRSTIRILFLVFL